MIRVQNSNTQPILVPTKPLFESSSNSPPPPLPAENQVTFQSPFSHRRQCTLFTHQHFAEPCIVSDFTWVSQSSQEKLKTIDMQFLFLRARGKQSALWPMRKRWAPQISKHHEAKCGARYSNWRLLRSQQAFYQSAFWKECGSVFFGNREWRGMEVDEPENGVVEDLYICYNSAEWLILPSLLLFKHCWWLQYLLLFHRCLKISLQLSGYK